MARLQKLCSGAFCLFMLLCVPLVAYSDNYSITDQNLMQKADAIDKAAKRVCRNYKKLVYYLYIEEFANSFIEIPTSNVSVDSSTISSKYLAGRASVYNLLNEKVGTCSASFLCMQNVDGIYTDISNYLSVDNGLIISWFTPTTLINLELDSIIHSMVTECIVEATTKVGFNPFYGKKFDMVVSSSNGKIYFKLSKR